MTTTEVAVLVRRHPNTVRQWRYLDDVEDLDDAERVGPRWIKLRSGGVLYRESAVWAWIEAQEAESHTA